MKCSLIARCAIIASALIMAGSSAFALEGSAIFGAETYKELKEKGSIERSFYMKDDAVLSLYPDTPAGRRAAASWTNTEEKPVFLVETLYLIPKEELGSGQPSKTTIEYASKIIRSVSKMQGMRYYSTSHKQEEVLYKEAHLIAGPNDFTRVEDDTAGSADGKTVYCVLHDNSFGKASYKLDYFERPDEVSGTFENLGPLKVGPIKAITPGNLIISLVISDCGDDMAVYLVTQAKFPSLKMFEKLMYNSFSTRLTAIFNWFCNQF